ncbi:O-antigen ligase family protein [Vibrio metschnikovii]|nr:O-antigen ligase family protein [Vibrio metschnikovii]
MTLYLLIYSLLPGFAKIFGTNVFFGFNIFIWMLFFRNVKLSKNELFVFLIVFIYVTIQTYQSILVNDKFQLFAFLESLYVWIIPFMAFFLAKKYSVEAIFNSLVYVGLCHAIIGLITYPLFPLPSFLSSLSDTLRDGVAFMRMSSVAGSLIFGVIISSSINALLYLRYCNQIGFKKFIIFFTILALAGFLSLQRSCWLSILVGITFYSFFKLNASLIFYPFVIVIVFSSVAFVDRNLRLDEFILDRVGTLFSKSNSPIDERFQIWVDGLYYLSENPFGYGIGQLGQFGFKNEIVLPFYITDGDYVKWAVELGLLGLLFFVSFVLYFVIARIFIGKFLLSKKGILHIVIIVGFLVQMIGSNLSEFYYANFIFWFVLGTAKYWSGNENRSSDCNV